MRDTRVSTARPRGETPALQERDRRVENQRDDGSHDEDHQHFARGPRQRPQREQGERQQHKLHPARHDHARRLSSPPPRLVGQLALVLGRRGRLGRLLLPDAHVPPVMGRVWLSRRRASRREHRDVENRAAEPAAGVPSGEPAAATPRPRSCSSATSSAASDGARCWSACRSCASATRRRSWSSTARTSPAASASRRRPPTSCSPAGVDAITLGNHAYHRREIYPYLDNQPRIVRPANYLRGQPGRGVCVVSSASGAATRGRQPQRQPLPAHRPLGVHRDRGARCKELGEVDHILVDMHAEATSEKVALGWHLDGRVSAVVGTHTHIPTADARVLPGGTAYITDVGMTGAARRRDRRQARAGGPGARSRRCRSASRPPTRTPG